MTAVTANIQYHYFLPYDLYTWLEVPSAVFWLLIISGNIF